MEKNAANDPIAELSINTIRGLAIDGVQHANSGHPGAPMGLAPVAYVIWQKFLRHNPSNPHWPGRDRFILSAGHASMLLYSLLHLTGYGVSIDDLKHFRQLGSITPGHPERGGTPGVEITTGPLGQGVSNGVGMALAEHVLAERFNRPGHAIVDSTIYAICSDGEIMEGVFSEAASFAGHLGLGNLVYVYDQNHISIEGATEITLTEQTARRFEAYDWHVQELGYETDLERIAAALEAARDERERPSLIVLNTHIAYGSPHKQDTAASHGAPLGEDEVKLTKENLGLPEDKTFYVPEEVAGHMDARKRGKELEREWKGRFAAYEAEHPDLAREWLRRQAGELPPDWNAKIPTFTDKDGPVATRKTGKIVLNAIAERLPELIGGSADLAPSTLTTIDGAGSIDRGSWSGRNLHFGVREHCMGSVLNGMTAFGGVKVYGSGFLIFSDYMRPTIRLAALMGLPVIFIFTHDSIFLGEDGPTHQPVEQLASLRAIPNLSVVRPADANETAAAWEWAIERRDGPTALLFSRQKLPVLDPSCEARGGARRGAYTVADSEETPQVILIGTGSEVHTALAAADPLKKRGVATRVVSMPSWDLFEAQPKSYRQDVLPSDVTARVAIEAGVGLGWERWVGDGGRVISIERFGASAPAGDLAEPFGLTPADVEQAALSALETASTVLAK